MKKAIILNLPLMDLGIPPANIAAIVPVIKKNKYEILFHDLNVLISNQIDSDVYNEFYSWCQLSIDISDSAKDTVEKWSNRFINSLPESDLIAVSVFSIWSIAYATILLPLLRQRFKNTTIIVGGSGVSSHISKITQNETFGQNILNNKWADYVIFGEGELSLDNVLKGLNDYPGVNKNNPSQIDDLDQLADPDFSVMNLKDYYNNRLLITGSRGCVRKCTFCDIENTWPNFKYRSPESVLNEIIRSKLEYGISRFEFTDSLINGSISNWIKFNDLLANAKQRDKDLEDITYSGQFICREESSHPKRMYELMHYAGAVQLTVGIESFSEHIRNLMKKKFTDKAIDYHLEQCGYWGIPNIFLMIVGYPGETIEDHKKSIDTLYRYKKYSDMGTIFMIRWGFTMHIYRDTNLFKNKDQLGIVFSQHTETDGLYNWISTIDPTLTLLERIRRRIELHEVSHSLGYSQPSTYSELTNLKSLAQQYNPIFDKKIINISSL